MILLASLSNDHSQSRVRRDRLELLTALINAPSFDSLYRAEIITIPPQHSVYAWQCTVSECERVRHSSANLCHEHRERWRVARQAGSTRAEFMRLQTPLPMITGNVLGTCRVCPERQSTTPITQLCDAHQSSWRAHHRSAGGENANFDDWLRVQVALPGYGTCRVRVCPDFAISPLGLCEPHRARYYRNDDPPGGASLPRSWDVRFQRRGQPVPISYTDEAAFLRWCATATAAYRTGQINLRGLAPLLIAEMQWGLYAHGHGLSRSKWSLSGIQRAVNFLRASSITSLIDVGFADYQGLKPAGADSLIRMICGEIGVGLRCVYYSPTDTKDAGFIETDHFGRRFVNTASTVDLTGVTQRWLRDLLWDYLANLLRSQQCPRSRGPFDNLRRGALELSAFLEAEAPEGGHNPRLLREEHAQRFIADQRHRARHGLTSIAITRKDGQLSTVTDVTLRFLINNTRRLLYSALTNDSAVRIELDSGFVTAFPSAGPLTRQRSRSPFTDELAKALVKEENLLKLGALDPTDQGLRDVWETIAYTGRRCSEVLKLRLDCIGRYGTLPMMWHNQTKVGNYDEAIRIPEFLYDRLAARRRKTLVRFEHRHGRHPSPEERAVIALFPSHVLNPHEKESVSYTTFFRWFRTWMTELDLGHGVAHQARHTLATNLLRAGANLTQIRRYLGQISDRMAEHYVKVAHSDLEDALHAVWVAGPGAATPGELLSGESTPLTREQALALALDLSRRSTPADGGFCTFQPVVQGGACPWKLDCENCDKFVLSGADLLYWRRKQEQWRSIAERAPDDATADYLHQVFEPTARAIAGLEKALAGLGLLDQALAMDLRRPQDYFHRIWSTAFHATDLADLADEMPPDLSMKESE